MPRDSTLLKRAIESGNLLAAEMTARQLGKVTLHEALLLTALVAEKDPSGGLGSLSAGFAGCSRRKRR